MESVVLKARQRETGDWVNVERAGWGPPRGGGAAPVRRADQREPAVDWPGTGALRGGPASLARLCGCGRDGLRGPGPRRARARGSRTGQRRSPAHSPARRRGPRPAHAAGRDQGGRQHLAPDRREWSDAEREELLAAIEQSSDRLDAIVANLLDASRLQAGVLSVMAEPIAARRGRRRRSARSRRRGRAGGGRRA